MPEHTLLNPPGPTPFERIARAGHYDPDLFRQLVYEHALILSGGLHGDVDGRGRMTPGELRHAALELATTALAVYAMLGSEIPLAALRAHAHDRAAMLEGAVA